jgi:oligopeptide transport system substrate-binding protein
VCITEEPSTIDPRKGGDAVSSQLQFMLFEGLTQLNEDGSISNAQASHIEISSDKKTYRFHLGNTNWSNGDIVTSYDFAKAWKTIIHPRFPSPNAHLLYPIKGAEQAKRGVIPLDQVGIYCPDGQTLIVELEKPTPYFLQLLSFCVFFPVHPSMDFKENAPINIDLTDVICNGPFTITEWKHQNEITLEKNIAYRKKDDTQIDMIHISIISSEMTALKMYEQGKLDFLGHPFSSLNCDELSRYQLETELQIIPAAATTFITFNTQNGYFKNKSLRKAFAYALDREVIVKNISAIEENVATRMIPPVLLNNRNKDLFMNRNKETARQLLLEAMNDLGISKKELETITFYYSKSEHNHKIAQVMQQQWHQTLGIMINLQSLESKTLLYRLGIRDYEMALTMWRAQFYDPVSILERFQYGHNIKNYPGWDNKIFAELINESGNDSGKLREEKLEKAEELLVQDIPLLPVYHWNLTFLHKKHIKNIQFSPVGGIFFERISVDQEL